MTEHALAALEWSLLTFLTHDGCVPTIHPNGTLDLDGCVVVGRERHAVAALALHDQPYGFTGDDVDAIRTAAQYDPGMGQLSMRLESLADKIEALLPPRAMK